MRTNWTRHTPKMPRSPVKAIRFVIDSLADRWRTRDGMRPPKSLNFVGGQGFDEVGHEFERHFVQLGNLQPEHRVLDVGCGVGRMAIPLTSRLSAEGAYYGFDIVKQGVDWCSKRITPRFGNFQFLHSDICNKSYNPTGKIKASEYRFPFDDRFFDFVFLTSVFTHLLPADMRNYLREIARVLKPGGKCLITFFLLNQESRQLIQAGRSSQNFIYDLGECFTVNAKIPEFSIAYAEASILDLYRECGLVIDLPIHYGAWCGRPQYLSYQDILVATKA